MTAQLVNTPYYVLLDGKQRLGPKLLRPRAGPEGVAIYGFSDKPPYDLFCANSELALTQKRFAGVERSEHPCNCLLTKPRSGYGEVGSAATV